MRYRVDVAAPRLNWQQLPRTHWNRGHCVTSRAFSPAFFSGGEGADRRMRGRFLALKLSVFMSFHDCSWKQSTASQEPKPLIRLRHLLPHAEKRVGEKDAR